MAAEGEDVAITFIVVVGIVLTLFFFAQCDRERKRDTHCNDLMEAEKISEEVFIKCLNPDKEAP